MDWKKLTTNQVLDLAPEISRELKTYEEVEAFAKGFRKCAELQASRHEVDADVVAWMWECIGKKARPTPPVARTIGEMDPTRPYDPTMWKPLFPLVKADASLHRVIHYMHNAGMAEAAALVDDKTHQLSATERPLMLGVAQYIRSFIRE
jgi:hypothetical protein